MAKSTTTTIEKTYNWVCNECNFPNYTGSVSKVDIEQENVSCINCGGFEFHKVEAEAPQKEVEAPHCIRYDKRYEEPFEDDGAYAD